jgi:spore germination cell wall hydrolase CwlJ-like protein
LTNNGAPALVFRVEFKSFIIAARSVFAAALCFSGTMALAADDSSAAPLSATAAIAFVMPDDVVIAAAPPVDLAQLASSVDTSMVAADDELACLAAAVYFESRGEPAEGQLAVAQTILNRVESGRFASTICGVINQPHQFSFDKSRVPRPGIDWQRAQAIARIATGDLWRDVVPRATAFHAVRVSPNWAGKTRVATIGNHVFYR